MEKRELIKIIVKVLIYALGLIATYFGVSTLTSCSVSRDTSVRGTTRIFTSDTTVIQHSSNFYKSPRYGYNQ